PPPDDATHRQPPPDDATHRQPPPDDAIHRQPPPDDALGNGARAMATRRMASIGGWRLGWGAIAPQPGRGFKPPPNS
ncbi:hypothetical protein NG799_29350, partial [Laspinema sp. D1]|nr:hypothetical protein [Laspinema sp. D2a]